MSLFKSLTKTLVKSALQSNSSRGMTTVERKYPSYPQSTIREVKVTRSKPYATSYTPEEMSREFDILDRGVGRKRK